MGPACGAAVGAQVGVIDRASQQWQRQWGRGWQPVALRVAPLACLRRCGGWVGEPALPAKLGTAT